MSKCKRNVLLIFGYLLIVAILFIPYSKEAYYIPKYIDVKKGEIIEIPAPPPGFILEKPLKPRGKLSKRPLNRDGFRILPLYIADAINHRRFKKWKKNQEEYWEKDYGKKDILTTEELFFYVESKFIEKYKGEFQYDRLRLEFFLTEIVAILIIGGFAYILFCVVLRKDKRGRNEI